MFKFLGSVFSFFANFFRSLSNGITSVNTQLDKVNSALEAFNERQDALLPIYTAKSIAAINKIRLKRIKRSRHFSSRKACKMIDDAYNLYSEIELFCKNSLSSVELSNKLINSEVLMNRLASLQKLHFDKTGFIRFIEKHRGSPKDAKLNSNFAVDFEGLNEFRPDDFQDYQSLDPTDTEIAKLRYLFFPLFGCGDFNFLQSKFEYATYFFTEEDLYDVSHSTNQQILFNEPSAALKQKIDKYKSRNEKLY